LVNLAIGVLPLAFLVGTSVMVERVPGIVPASPGGRSHWAGALAALALSVSALVLQNLFSPAQAALGELVTRRVDGHVTRRLMRSALAEAPMEVLDSQDVLDKLSDARRGLQETWSTPGGAVAGLMALVARYTQLAGSVVIVAAVVGVGWGAVICSCAMVARFGNRGSLGLFSRVWSTWVHDKRRLDYVYESGTDVAMAKEMRVLGVLPWWKDRAGASAASFYERLWKERRHIYFAPFLVFTALVLAGTVATLLAVRAEAVGGHLDVLRFVLAVQAVLVPLRFGVFFPEADLQTQFGMSSWEVMAELGDRFVSGGLRQHAGRLGAEGMPRRSVRFDKVGFAYPGSSRLVLDDLDLELPEGTSTAIVGFNGAGKTTLVKLLAGLYRPGSGRISVDGVDLGDIDVRSWQKRLAIIFQDFVRYELDAATNIALGAPGLGGEAAEAGPGRSQPGAGGAMRYCEEALLGAAAAAGAGDVLSSLPRGLATPLSSRYSGGVDLSGGQWQRVALARAMYAVRGGASVLVLDEPTAQLDVRAEVAFFDRFLELTEGLTTVIISHRFSTVRRAQRIVVLEHGRVAEQGPHDELVSLGGRYAELFELQARRFAAGAEDSDEGDEGDRAGAETAGAAPGGLA
jgi:ATP-binding cassette subfamily B protein